MTQDPQELVWKQQSSRWKNVGQPTRPSTDDGEIMLRLANAVMHGSGKPVQIVVLGVTPEVVQLDWCENAELHAFDQSAAMIDAVWQPHHHISSTVAQSYWQSLPLAAESVDIVVGDGCLTALQGRDACHDVLAEMVRILKPSGRLVMRCFIRPPGVESLEKINSDVMQGSVELFGSLKWRLAMALCDVESSTVRPHQITDTFDRLFPDRAALARTTGWNRETINTIDSYRNMDGVFTFLTEPEFTELCSTHFEISDIQCGNYELSDRCPTVSLLPISDGGGVGA